MKFLLQRRTDGRYYGGPDSWVESAEQAHSFPTVREAYDFCDAWPNLPLDVIVSAPGLDGSVRPHDQ